MGNFSERDQLFVPPAPGWRLHDYTQLRVDLIDERARYWQLLEEALIKVSAVALRN